MYRLIIKDVDLDEDRCDSCDSPFKNGAEVHMCNGFGDLWCHKCASRPD